MFVRLELAVANGLIANVLPATKSCEACAGKVTVCGVAPVACAVQLAFDTPLLPKQVQLHGPEPVTVEAVPAAQRFVVGATVKEAPFAVPQTPIVYAGSSVISIEST
jgi:hypothetical protein